MKKIIYALILISLTLFMPGCSIVADFVIVNDSEQIVTINVHVKEFKSIENRMMSVEQFAKNDRDQWTPLPGERFKLGEDGRSAEIILNPKEVFLIARPDVFYDDKSDEFLGIDSLSIHGEKGLIMYEGDQVLKNFSASRYDWFSGSNTLYKITYG